MSLHDPPEEWSDDEIRFGLVEAGKSHQWHVDQHQHAEAEAAHLVARMLAAERDRRKAASIAATLVGHVDTSDLEQLDAGDIDWPWADDVVTPES